MAPSFDFTVSSLLCAEDNNSILGNVSLVERNHRDRNRNFAGDLGLLMESDESLALMVGKEFEHFPNLDYLNRLRMGHFDLNIRNQALDWILKVHAHFGFGPLCVYRSINYLDRFLSAYEVPKGKAWMIQLLAVSCISLAAKMEETEVPLSLDLQVCECKFVFEARTIQKMELLVLNTLKWRMQAITPFSFIDQFLNKINNAEEETQFKPLILRSIQLILSTLRGIDFLEFRPSEIAAAVAIAVYEKPIPALFQHVHKDRVVKCVELIYEMALIGEANGSSQSLPQSPVGVLDAADCLSYRSCANSSQNNTSEAKRRKLNTQWEQV